MSAINKAIRAGHAAAARLAMSSDPTTAALSQPHTARDMLNVVAAALRARGHADAEMDFIGRHLVVAGHAVAWATSHIPERVRIGAAAVFDGHTHVVPPGCDTSTLTPGSRACTVERIVAAIEKRIAARAKSLPVPVDASAIVRDP